MWNDPIGIFDRGRGPGSRRVDAQSGVDGSTLGFHLGLDRPANAVPIGNLAEFAKALYESVVNVQADFFTMVDEDVSRTVFIDDPGLSATGFGLTLRQNEELIANGSKATRAYLGI